jgi:hypothetical protein
MYLLAIITLVAGCVSLGSVLFDLVNVYLPDLTQVGSWYFQSILSSLRMGMATLIIVFPIFAWLTRTLNKDLETAPERRESRIRKWLLYLTLFVAALFVIGDLVSILRSFLNGELTTRFLIKSGIVLAIAGSTFYYYLSYLRWQSIKWASILGKVIIVLVIATIVFGFYVSGSPMKSRSERMDQTRISDLQNIQSQIVNYWQSKTVIPQKLSELNDSISGFVIPVDPETGLSYEYIPGTPVEDGAVKFELCAIFKTNTSSSPFIPMGDPAGRPTKAIYPLADNWDHGTGRVCFSRSIDPQLYPPKINQ